MRMVDKSSVQYAITSGKIQKAVVEKDGKILIDVEIANQEWDPRFEATRSAVIPPGSPLLVLPGGGSHESGSSGPTDEERIVPQSVSKAKRETYEAEMARLKLEQIQGKLVESEEVEQRWISIASLVRMKVTGIPSKTRQRIPELTDEQYDVLESICREALEELTNENISTDEDIE
jgi:hypothetical protein